MLLTINTEQIALDALLKWANVVVSGGEAKYIISEGLVRVNGEVVTQRKKKLSVGDIVSVEGLEEAIELAREN
ncbi:RNA-binding S4 domain-containing protein [Clostridia bacterium]|nr:RNA-binding S4 domain-containing protein [Clostridia bacterium]